MKMATLNINWANKQKSKSHIYKIEDTLLQLDADILVITESVQSLSLPSYKYVYQTQPIPANIEYEGLNYSKYLNNETAVRVSLYSKYESAMSFDVTDKHTSVCNEFITEKGPLIIYATIIGTKFNQMPYAKNELDNCTSDCTKINEHSKSICLIGDLNTSFLDDEKDYQIKGIQSRNHLEELAFTCDLDLTTKNIPLNIDHIFLPKIMANSFEIKPSSFVAKNVLSDHQGILVEIN